MLISSDFLFGMQFSHMLEQGLDLFLYFVCAYILAVSLYLLTLSIASLRKLDFYDPNLLENGRIAIIVPAHNEAEGIARTVQNLLHLALIDGRADVIVIADNCTDQTAEIANGLGAKVLVRNNHDKRGKGYALDFAFQQLKSANYSVFLIVDADTQTELNLLASLRILFGNGISAVQFNYGVLGDDLNLVKTPRFLMSCLALSAFNYLRPKAREVLGSSVGILGNGFALSQKVISEVPYTANSVVEDLEYHLRLIQNNIRVHFSDLSKVSAAIPASGKGQSTQRSRWEGGRLRMMLDHGAPLLLNVLSGNFRMIEPLLELLLLPLSYHVMLLTFALMVPSALLFKVALFGFFVITVHIFSAAYISSLRLTELLGAVIYIPYYLIWKLKIISKIFSVSKKSSTWMRTERDIDTNK